VKFEANELIATSEAVEFLSNGHHPVLINKLRHLPVGDWQNDLGDVRNLVASISRDRKVPLNWQVVDAETASVDELSEAPILFLNGHLGPELSARARSALRQYVERGGCVLAEACCSSREFDSGFRQLVSELFPESEHKLQPLSAAHPVWQAKDLPAPEDFPLWGVQFGSRTAVIYSPRDLSCSWNESETATTNEAVIHAMKLGSRIVAYFGGHRISVHGLMQP
jgi:hypothetical protein